MKIGVIADREFKNDHRVKTWFNNIQKTKEPFTLLTGDGPGVDRLLQKLCSNNKKDCVVFKPIHLIDSKALFKVRYFFIRNQQIIHNSDAVVVFISENPDGGTKWAMDFAQKNQKEVFLVREDA